jgi:hypothetical protein
MIEGLIIGVVGTLVVVGYFVYKWLKQFWNSF